MPHTHEGKDVMADFTPTQGRYLAFIRAYLALRGYPPAESEIAAALCVSPPSVNQMAPIRSRRTKIRRSQPATKEEKGWRRPYDKVGRPESEAGSCLWLLVRLRRRLVSSGSGWPDRESHPDRHLPACHQAGGQISAAVLRRIMAPKSGNDVKLEEKTQRGQAKTQTNRRRKAGEARAKAEVHDDLHQWQTEASTATSVDWRLACRGIHRQECRPHLVAPEWTVGINDSWWQDLRVCRSRATSVVRGSDRVPPRLLRRLFHEVGERSPLVINRKWAF